MPLALMIDDQEGQEDDRRSDPIQHTGVLSLENDLSDERQRDGEAESDRDHQWRGEQHRIGPTYVGYE